MTEIDREEARRFVKRLCREYGSSRVAIAGKVPETLVYSWESGAVRCDQWMIERIVNRLFFKGPPSRKPKRRKRRRRVKRANPT